MILRSTLAIATAALLTGAALAQEERPDRLIGGSVEELSAILGVQGAQRTTLQGAYDETAAKYRDVLKTLRDQGLMSAQDDLDKLRADCRKKVTDLLQPNQRPVYESLLKRKDTLAAEYEKALFGLPPVTGIRVKLALNESDCAAMQKVNDKAVEAISKKVVEMSNAKEESEKIVKAVNELRKQALTDLIAASPRGLEGKIRDAVYDFIKPVEEKITPKERNELDKVMKALDIKEKERVTDTRRKIASIFMHRAEMAPLNVNMLSDLGKIMLNKKKEPELWLRMDDYKTLLDIHRRRIDALQDELRSTATTKQVYKLIAERIVD